MYLGEESSTGVNGYSASSEDSDSPKGQERDVSQRQKVFKHRPPPQLSEGRPRSSSDDSVSDASNPQQSASQPASKEGHLFNHPNFAVISFVKNMSGNEETLTEMVVSKFTYCS